MERLTISSIDDSLVLGAGAAGVTTGLADVFSAVLRFAASSHSRRAATLASLAGAAASVVVAGPFVSAASGVAAALGAPLVVGPIGRVNQWRRIRPRR
jgi:hypothetical protein